MTPLARFSFYGPAPLTVIDANTRGSGKGLLSDTISEIVSGRKMSVMSPPKGDEECRKRITSIALAGDLLVLIDNIAGEFGCPSLDAALTATSWSDRLLGTNIMASGIPLLACWYATGNNIILVGDTPRRSLHIRLDSPVEKPEERTDFKHPALLPWVRQQRPRLLAAALTILRGYCAAGRPDMGLTPWGSYEAWSAIIPSAIVWAGLTDPGKSRTNLADAADREAAALRMLIDGWEELDPDRDGATVANALKRLADSPDDYELLRTAINELMNPQPGKFPSIRSVGMKLHHLRKRVIGGRFMDSLPGRNGANWAVYGDARPPESPGECGTNETSGTIPGPLTRAYACARAHENPEGAVNSPATSASPADDDENAVFEEFMNS